jgi:membrane associated rhomboid family serine protease
MDEAAGENPLPDPPDPGGPENREAGLVIETCYRHPNETTGVHCTRCGRPICPDCMRPAPVGYQCPECVREARRTAPRRRVGVKFILGRPGVVTTGLIAANVVMFVVEIASGASRSLFLGGNNLQLFQLGALVPRAIAAGQYWRLFTSMFLHIGLLHLLLNMYALYLFGFLIENTFGSLRYLALYLVAGFVAGSVSFAFGPPNQIAAGASGAIFGLLGAWFAYNYRRREMRFNRANLQGALMLIVLNLVISFSIPGIDWRDHLGGLVAGAVAAWTIEGVGPPAVRRLLRVGGFVLLILAGVALTAWRVAWLRTHPAGLFG